MTLFDWVSGEWALVLGKAEKVAAVEGKLAVLIVLLVGLEQK